MCIRYNVDNDNNNCNGKNNNSIIIITVIAIIIITVAVVESLKIEMVDFIFCGTRGVTKMERDMSLQVSAPIRFSGTGSGFSDTGSGQSAQCKTAFAAAFLFWD